MKLAYILNTYPEGSHTFIRREIAALERQGHEVSRIAMRAPAVAPGDEADRAEQAKTQYVLRQGAPALARAVARRARRRGFAAASRLAWRAGRGAGAGRLRHGVYLAEACYVADRLVDEDVQHMHAHFGTNAATVAMLVSALTDIPFSFTVHGPEEFDRPETLELPEKLHRAAFAVAVSQYGRSQLCRWVAPEFWSRIRVVHCGIDPAEFQDPPALPAKAGLVCIGRFAEQKGHLTLIEAMGLLGAEAPALRLVGDGPMRREIQQAVTRHGLDDRITLTGWLDGDAVRRELATAQALVMPSFAEGLPVAIMEAMAMRRPVIATYIAGIPELVRPEKTGWLVPAGDARALADAVRGLVETPFVTLQQMGRAGRERALERHDVDAEAARLAGYIANAAKS